MQLLYPIGLTGKQYVKARAWEYACLPVCPNHPHGGCSFAHHGTYARKTPRGCRVARWYCPESHMTFSLLPECLPARLPGTLRRLEEVVAEAERASSLAAVPAPLGFYPHGLGVRNGRGRIQQPMGPDPPGPAG